MSSFSVCSVPSDNDTKTNQVYLSQADFQAVVGSPQNFLINDFPFAVRGHDKVSQGSLAMNSIQRRLLGLSTTAGCMVRLKYLNPKQPDIDTMAVRLEHIIASRKGGTLDCADFNQFVKAQFMGQCFKAGQQLAAVLDNGMRLLVTVDKLILNPADSKADLGYMSVQTAILVSVVGDSGIALVNVTDKQLDAQQTQLIQNFNLENLGIGGLRSEFSEVFRRAFASRIFPASYVKKLGIKHVKGVLLFGPPGTGKTLIARKIGEILNCKEPKIVNGPEVFNKFVGGTEENIRKLFTDAEADQAAKGDQSALHLIIFDEFDAICKQRGALRDSTGVNDNVVNQLLSKIDGINSLNNVLLIGMTNRKDLIDDAILRPGRFEVHVEIGLPDESGRAEIFRIHTRGMRESGVIAQNVDLMELARLAANYSGAEIEGVVRSATSNAFNRHIDFDHPTDVIDPNSIFVTRDDFLKAIAEVTPAFGQAKEECVLLQRGGIINYGTQWDIVNARCHRYVDQLKSDGKRISSLAVLVDGPAGCGKSAVAGFLAQMAGFPYVKVVSSDDMVGYGELQKVNIMRKAFEDAYKSSASCIVLDDLERLIEFSQLGGRYSNALLQALLVLIKRQPPDGKKLLVVATTAQYDIIDSLELASCFSVKLQLPLVPPDALPLLAKDLGLLFATSQDMQSCIEMFPRAFPIKQLLLIMEMAADRGAHQTTPTITLQSMSQALESAGVH